MSNSVIGALRITLGINTAAFEKGLNEAQRKLNSFGKQFQQIGGKLATVGASMTRGVTLPIIAAAGAVGKFAGDFEASMNRVEAATGATGAQLKALRDQAKAFGADKTFTATAKEAADVMEMLAKNGLTATQILGGAAKATLMLAAATGGQFAPAADLASNIMQQFGKQASDLPGIVDKVTGALLVSKFGFEDYAAAIGQVGGVAGGLGMSFEDMNTAIAATAALFGSGSDAGTSFKTFLTSLTPQSKEASAIMKKLGLDFFDAAGNMKPLAAIAQELQDKIGGLNKEAQTEVLKKLFGSDAMRTAIGLMGQGADGIARINGEIAKGSAQAQMEARMKGLAAGLVQLKKAFEALSIAIGDSGFLQWATGVIGAVTDMIRAFSQLPAPILKVVSVLAGVVATIGPLLFIGGKLVGLWGSLLRWSVLMAPQWLAVRAGLAGWAASSTLAAGAFGALRASMAFLLGPWGLVIGGISIAFAYLAQQQENAAQASEEYRKQQELLNNLQARGKTLAEQLAVATGKAREEALKNAQALRQETIQYLANARAAAIAAQAKAQQARQNVAESLSRTDPRSSSGFAQALAGGGGVMGGAMPLPNPGVVQASTADMRAQANLAAAQKNVSDATKELATIEGMIAAAGPPGVTAPTGSGSSFSMPDDSSGRKRQEKDLALRREIMKVELDLQVAQLRGDKDEERRLQRLLDIKQRQQDYEQAGLKAQNAKVAAITDQVRLDAAIAESNRRELETDETRRDLEIATINGDYVAIRQAQAKLDFEEDINRYRERGLTLAQATAKALDYQAQKEGAIADATKRRMDETERGRQISLARLRGDTDQQIRAMESVDFIARRADQIGSDSGGTINAADALAQAQREAAEENKAYNQGYWRNTIQSGFKAALDGNFGSWFEGWWKDRVASALEKALNSLADLIADLFSKAGNDNGSGGGGLLSILGSLFGGGGFGGIKDGLGGAKSGIVAGDEWGGFKTIMKNVKLPGFANGGSFKFGGKGGIDQNVLSLNGSQIARVSKGEIATISKGKANDNGGGIAAIVPSPLFDVVMEGKVLSTGGQMMQQSARSSNRRAQQSLLGRR